MPQKTQTRPPARRKRAKTAVRKRRPMLKVVLRWLDDFATDADAVLIEGGSRSGLPKLLERGNQLQDLFAYHASKGRGGGPPAEAQKRLDEIMAALNGETTAVPQAPAPSSNGSRKGDLVSAVKATRVERQRLMEQAEQKSTEELALLADIGRLEVDGDAA